MEESMRIIWRHSLVGPRASRPHLLREKSGRHTRRPGPALLALSLIAGFSAQALSAEYLEGNERQKSRAYSPAVITEGGRIVWLAGQTGGNTGDFETQAREAFRQIDLTLKRAGGSLADMVTMTVFINDPRNGDRLTEMRREIFPAGRYPGSALITVSNFAVPGILIEVQGVAVIGDRCSNTNPCSPR
jgi:enamine deaminase RidA (YjgF/YER057c/UK114 family)